ncbi:hypothetical protein Ae201684P_015630 [Aphanomyces euteiches]|uniref:Protein kinase domain-containing protein n=1 Tax=Aphanomyces euteiches TaxID=100861 RepID=A0A6G0W9C6_9STRA|nr:hypothetical protein Ae201684_017875 [Aphanomyces euteiches]KAH9095180.1 hypothetical protein Ae201684P_015630 [Aphanomyces euteiches]
MAATTMGLLVLCVLVLFAGPIAADVVDLVISTNSGRVTRSLSANESIERLEGTIAFMSVPPTLVLVTYSGSSFSGQLVFVSCTYTDNHRHALSTASTGSLVVLTYNETYALVRENNPTDVIVEYTQLMSPLTWFDRISVGQGVRILADMLPWMLTSMDIPSGADVDAYRHENFEGPAISWSKTSTSAFLKSFRTRWQNETMPEPKPLDHVTLYSGGYASNATLSMTAGQAVPTTSFLWQTFQFGFFGVEVPQGLVLLSYLQPSFDGPYTIFRRGFHSYPPQLIPSRLNSFLVLHETDPLPAQTPTNVPEVVCQMELDTISIPLGSSYPYIKPEFCSTLKIPPGLTVILFDRPWFLGGYSLWTQVDGEKLPWVWISRMRSLRVVKHEEAPPSMPYSVHDDDYVKSFVWKFASMMFKIGEAVPGVGEYEKRSKTPIAFTIPPGIVLVLCSDFNFEGSCMSYNRSVADDEELLATYKSYKVLRSNESSQDNLTSTDFVGCYPPANPYLSWTPIFLQANDTIDELIYPWDQNILRFTVPRGLVVVAFSGSHFQGECFAWMTDANDIGEWNRKIRSLMVLPASNWSGCELVRREDNMIHRRKPTAMAIAASSMPTITTPIPPSAPTPAAGFKPREIQPEARPTPSTSLSFESSNSTKDERSQFDKQVIISSSTHSDGNATSSWTTSAPPELTLSIPSSSRTETKQDASFSTTQAPSMSLQPASNGFDYLPLAIACCCGLALVAIFVTRCRLLRQSKALKTPHDFSSISWRDLDLWRLDIPPLPLTHRLATGATGLIYLSKLNGQSVAIKTLADPTSTNIQAFVDEIMYATQLQNPFIVSLIGVAWTTATDLQCVMEYMNLGDLRSYLSSVKSIAWESKVACALSVAEGLFYLHVQQCIHRDVKSRNILLDSVKGAKLGDFGVSKEVIYGDTMTAAVGTLRWMAPEMMLFQPYSSAVDIFSFGVVLSEMSTHEMPYADLVDSSGQSLSEEAIAGCVIHDKLRPSFGKCPPWFKTLGLKCMSEVPQDRPTAVQLIFELKSQLQQLRRRGLSESRSDTHRVEMRNT